MTSKVTESEFESALDETECGATAGQGSRMRRGDISAKVTREMRRMIHKVEKKGMAKQAPFQALAESCGFKVISEDETSDCEREFESDFPSSDEGDDNSTTSTACTSCCYSDHEIRDSRGKGYQLCGQPISSASELSHCKEPRGCQPRGKPRAKQVVSEPRVHQGNMWTVEAGKSVWKRIEPVVDNLESPRDSSANHLPSEDSLPAKCKNLAIQSSGRSAFRPVIARCQDTTADCSRTTGTKYKIFMGSSSCSDADTKKSPRGSSGSDLYCKKKIVITKNVDKKSGHCSGVRTMSRDRDTAQTDKEVEDTFKISKNPRLYGGDKRIHEVQLEERGRKAGGMINRLREMNDGFRLGKLHEMNRPMEMAKENIGPRRSAEHLQNSVTEECANYARKRGSITAGGLKRQISDGQLVPVGPRYQRSDVQAAPYGAGNVTMNSNIDEMSTPMTLPGGRVADATPLEGCSSDDKRHVDYRRNVNSNYEDTDTGDEIRASVFIGQYLYELWKNQCLCDVRIRVGKSSYLAHKIVLAAFSEVFCPNEPQKMPSLCFDIPNSTPDAVYQILLYLYTSEMELTDGILEEVLNAACFMGIWEVICLIKEILSKPTFENFGLYLEIRERQGMSAGLLDFPEIVRDHLLELIDTPYFLNLAIEDLETLLKDPDIMVESELDIVNVISKWIEYDPFHRMKCAARLLSLVNFDSLSAETLFDIVEEKKHLFDMDAIQVLLEAFKTHALKPKDCHFNTQSTEGVRERRQQLAATTNECASNCEPILVETCDSRCVDPQVKSFKEIRDQFASQRQMETRRVLPRRNIAKQYVNSHAVPYEDKQPPPPVHKPPYPNKPPSRASGYRPTESPCNLKQCPTSNDNVRAVREFHLSSATPAVNVEGPGPGRNQEQERRTSVERRGRITNGAKPLPMEDNDERNCKPKQQQPCYSKGRPPPEDCCVKGNKSPQQDVWGNVGTYHPASRSPVSGWAKEDPEHSNLPSRRMVRRRGDIIGSGCSPGSDKAVRKRVTFS